MRTLLLAAFILLTSFYTQAQDKKWPLDAAKGSTVVLKIPKKMFGFDKINAWRGTVSYAARVSLAPDGAAVVNADPAWQTSGMPYMSELRLEKISRQKDGTEVELRRENVNFKLRFDGSVTDINSAFRQVAYAGDIRSFEATDYYQKNVLDRVLPSMFPGVLSKIPRDTQADLLRAAGYDEHGFGGEEFKGKFYFVVKAEGEEVYNSIQLNQTARVARIVEKYVIDKAKSYVGIGEAVPEVYGIKVVMQVPYRDFVEERDLEPHYDQAEFYIPVDLVKKFKDAEITNQDLLDGSVVLVNGNRVKVNLATSR